MNCRGGNNPVSKVSTWVVAWFSEGKSMQIYFKKTLFDVESHLKLNEIIVYKMKLIFAIKKKNSVKEYIIGKITVQANKRCSSLDGFQT